MAIDKKKTPATPPPSMKQVTGIASGECPSLYTNFMGVGATPFDISIIFAEVEQRGSSVEAVPRIKVMMAPEQAANLVGMLKEALKQYVSQHGELRSGGRLDMRNEG